MNHYVDAWQPKPKKKLAIHALPWQGVRAVAEILDDPRGDAWRSEPPEDHYASLCRHMLSLMEHGFASRDPHGRGYLAKVATRALMLLEVTR